MTKKKPPFGLTVVGESARRLPDLVIHNAERPASARALDQLFSVQIPPRLFVRIDGTVVHVIEPRGGDPEIIILERDCLINLTHDICIPVRHTDKGRVECTLPNSVADLMLAIPTNERALPTITGITTGPLMRDDGSIRTAPGYDAETGMFLYNVPELKLKDRPTRHNAEQSFRQLRHIFRTFAFADATTKQEELDVDGKPVSTKVVDLDQPPDLNESAFLHALLTAPQRATLWLAPGFVYKSPSISGSGVGKSLLAKAPSVIASGTPPATSSLGRREEFEKGLVGLLLRGGHSILIDNVNDTTLRSNTLCTALSDRPALLRALGSSRLVPVNSTTLISITGCALDVGRDLVRRTLQIELDAKTEHPERRTFKDGFLADVAARRVELLQHVLTILCWAKQNPQELKRGKSFGTYDEWTRAVRDPLLTLGCPDPVRRIAQLKISDPDRIAIFEVFEKWEECHGDDWVTAHTLHREVQDLLLGGRKFSRQRVASEVHRLLGTRLGHYLVEEKPKTDKWAPHEYRLIREAAEQHDDEEKAQWQDAPGSNAGSSAPILTELKAPPYRASLVPPPQPATRSSTTPTTGRHCT
jgi:hypothetical protein